MIQNDLILKFLPYSESLAWQCYQFSGKKAELEEMKGVAALKLVEATRRYWEKVGAELESYVAYIAVSIRNGLSTFLRDFVPTVILVSLDQPLKEGEEGWTLADMLPDQKDYISWTETREFSRSFYQTLEEKDRPIFEYRLLGLAQVEIAEKLGTNPMKISRSVSRIKNAYQVFSETEV